MPPLEGTLTIVNGSMSATISIATIDDDIGELAAENFTVQLSNPSLGIILESEATVEILADVVTVEFSQVSYTVSEGDTAVTLTVVLTGDTPTSNITVDVMTINGTATGIYKRHPCMLMKNFIHATFSIILNISYFVDAMDYNALMETITFTAGGSNTQNIGVSTIDDSTAEGPENFTVTLANPSPGVSLGASSTATVEISADVLTVGFNETSYTVSEGDTAMLTVVLSGDTPTSNVTVMVATVNGTAKGMLIEQCS